jgi:glycosyltransferase involved in cell wall biosynthesis
MSMRSRSIWRRFWRCGREYGTERAAASTTTPTSTDSIRRPFNLFERYAFRHAAHAFACSTEAAAIIRRHGVRRTAHHFAAVRRRSDLYAPARRDRRNATLVVGYIGRLVPEKGVIDLVEAVARAPSVRLRLIGDGRTAPGD